MMWVSYFKLWVAVPIIFIIVSVGSFQKAPGSPFSPKSHSFGSIYTYLYLHVCSFCTMYLNFGSFYASGFFIDPQYLLFIFRTACGTPVMLLSLRGSGFGTQLPPKIGSLAKTFLLAPSHNERELNFNLPAGFHWVQDCSAIDNQTNTVLSLNLLFHNTH